MITPEMQLFLVYAAGAFIVALVGVALKDSIMDDDFIFCLAALWPLTIIFLCILTFVMFFLSPVIFGIYIGQEFRKRRGKTP